MRKKAFINIILLGFILISSIIVFLSTTSDDIVWKNKYFNLKKITDSHALSLAGAYNEYLYNNVTDESTDAIKAKALVIANNILNNSNLGDDASNYMTETWCLRKEADAGTCTLSELCENNSDCGGIVTATITNYQHDNFWYKFLGKDQFTFEHIESVAEVINDPDKPPSDFLPIAVNGCDQNYTTPLEYDFLLSTHDEYEDYIYDSFYALSEPGGGQSSFAHFKNVINDILSGKDSFFDKDTEVTTISDVYWDDVDNDVKQVSQSFDITNFTKTPMSILVLDCGSTPTDLKVKGYLPIMMTDVWCAPDEAAIKIALDDNVSVFTEAYDLYWLKSVPSCNTTKYFRIHFEVTGGLDTTMLEK